jgi:hypothetical protein
VSFGVTGPGGATGSAGGIAGAGASAVAEATADDDGAALAAALEVDEDVDAAGGLAEVPCFEQAVREASVTSANVAARRVEFRMAEA